MTIFVLLIAGTIVIFASNIYGRSAANSAFDRLLTGAVLQVAEAVYVREGELAVDIPLSAFQLLSLANNDRIYYRVVGLNGETITGYPHLSLNTPSRNIEIQDDQFFEFSVRKASITMPIIEQDVTGTYSVVIAQTTNARELLAKEITTRALLLLGILGAVVLALIAIAIRWAMRPMHLLESELQNREPLDFSPLSTMVPREMTTFVGTINHFMQRLSRRIDTMQRLVADSVHQIRTPIAALQAQAELPIDEGDIPAHNANKARILAQSQELSHLSEQLLTQALISHRADTILTERIDLRKIAVDAERVVRSTSLWPEDAIELDLCEDIVEVIGDRFSLREALKNLIVNALTYGDTPVTISVSAIGKISVHDLGNGFDPVKIASRFKHSAKNTGLGLAIIHDVIDHHDAELLFERPPSGGFTAAIQFKVVS